MSAYLDYQNYILDTENSDTLKVFSTTLLTAQ